MFACHIRCYPWDLLDEGLTDVLDCLRDRIGATGLTLIVATDEMEQFRPRFGVEPRIYRATGGVYFLPNEEKYQATRLKPPVWEQHRKMDVLAKVSEECASRQLDLRVSINPLLCRRLVGKHPEAACKNAYGIATRNALCPGNPDVRQYVLSLVGDLSGYDDVSAIVIEDVQRPPATDPGPHVQALAMFDTDVADLLNVCFCESCLQGAERDGIDGQAALRCVRSALDRLSSRVNPQGWTLADLLADNPSIAHYIAWADAVYLDLLKRLQEVSSKSIVLSFRNAPKTFVELEHAPDLFALADRITVDAEDLEGVIDELSRGDRFAGVLTPASVKNMDLLLRMDEGSIDEAPEVVRQLTWAAEAGAGGTTVSHFGAILDHQLDWLHQGLRNARRVLQQ